MIEKITNTRDSELSNHLIDLRRLFHRHPEIGFAEFWTTARICENLEGINCQILFGKELLNRLPDPEKFKKKLDEGSYIAVKEGNPDDKWLANIEGVTGVVAIVKGKAKGPKVGFRFDIDGLPITEFRDESHRPYKEGFYSTTKHMHACGHDGHMAIGIGLVKRIAERVDHLKGEYYFIFQPAEELIMGGKVFSKLNFVKDLDFFFPIHVGLIGVKKIICGVSFLADKRYHISFKGRSCHSGAIPEEGRNALLAACNAASALYGISRHSGGSSRINIGQFHSKNASNIISDKAEFELDLRGQTNEVCDFLTDQAKHIIKGAAAMQNVQVDIGFVTEAVTAENSLGLISKVKEACLELGIKPEDILDNYLISGSEDATFIMNEVLKSGGLTTYIGIGSPTYGGHHNEKFDFDEDVLILAVNLLFKLAQKVSSS